MCVCVCVLLGMDTGVVEKEAKQEYRPGFMDHFDKKDEQKKKVGRKQGPQGPHDISYYFPDIPDGMDFRDFVSNHPHSQCYLSWDSIPPPGGLTSISIDLDANN